jgi:hypothetical protein
MKENTTKDMDVYSKDSTVIERPESYAQGVKVGWTAPAKWWNWLFKNVTERLKDIFVTTTSIHNEIKNAVGGTLDPESDTQLKDKLEQMKKDLEDMTAQVSANLAALEATKAKPNGLASLDPDGRIPYSQLPESAMEFKGDWDASTNTPTLVDGTGDLGDMYLVSVGGTVDLGSGSITFLDGDRVIYNQAGKWEKISGGSVKSVNNATPDDTGNVNVVVDTDHIKDSAVTTGKIAQGAVTSGKIANGAVTEEDIANGAVTSSKIANGAVTEEDIANGAVTTGKIADRAVTAGSIADRAITTSKIADRTVTADKILDRAVTTGKIADSAVTTGKIAQGSIIEENIANGAITARKCKSGSNLYMHYIAMYEVGSTNNYDIRFSIIADEETLNSITKLASYMYRVFGTDTYIPCSGRVFVSSENCISLGICAHTSTLLRIHVIKTSNHTTYTKDIDPAVNHTNVRDTVRRIIYT